MRLVYHLIALAGLLLAVPLLAACSGGTEATAPADDGPTIAPPTVTVTDALPTAAPPEVAAPSATPPPTVAAAAVPTAESSLPTNAEGEPLVARVNGEGITQTDYQQALQRISALPSGTDVAQAAAGVLDTLIEQTLIAQAAAEQGIVLTDEEIAAEYAAHRELVDSETQWLTWLEANGYTDAQFREEVIPAQLLTVRLRDVVTGITGEALNEVRARHILVPTEAEANAVLARLQAGEDFALLAMELSGDVSTRDQGGDLGWFIREDLFVPELADIAFSLAPGEIAGPVVTSLGYHVIQTLETRTRSAVPEEQALIAEQQFNRYLDDLWEAATIERYV